MLVSSEPMKFSNPRSSIKVPLRGPLRESDSLRTFASQTTETWCPLFLSSPNIDTRRAFRSTSTDPVSSHLENLASRLWTYLLRIGRALGIPKDLGESFLQPAWSLACLLHSWSSLVWSLPRFLFFFWFRTWWPNPSKAFSLRLPNSSHSSQPLGSSTTLSLTTLFLDPSRMLSKLPDSRWDL